jgi:hypothetical protein
MHIILVCLLLLYGRFMPDKVAKVPCTVYSQKDQLQDHFVVGRDRLTVDKDKMHHQYIYVA